MNFNHIQLERWMQLIRTHPDGLDAFWPSQVNAKAWLVDEVNQRFPRAQSCIIFGSWYGVLADMLTIEDITCVDKQEFYLEWCAQKYTTWGGCMAKYSYDYTPDLVINTSTEHVSQKVYDTWFDNIPEGTHYIIQGNNDFSEKDHVRAYKDIDLFAFRNNLTDALYLDELPYEGPWDYVNGKSNPLKRFMGIGKK